MGVSGDRKGANDIISKNEIIIKKECFKFLYPK